MLKDIAEAMLGRRPFDLVIRNVQIVNVFSASIVSGSIGIVNYRRGLWPGRSAGQPPEH